MLENEPRLEKSSYHLNDKSKQLVKNIVGLFYEALIQPQNSLTNIFTASKTKNSRNDLLPLKQYFMEEINDLKNKLKVLNNFGNESSSLEITTILKRELYIFYNRIIKIEVLYYKSYWRMKTYSFETMLREKYNIALNERRSIALIIASLNIFAHDVINILHSEH